MPVESSDSTPTIGTVSKPLMFLPDWIMPLLGMLFVVLCSVIFWWMARLERDHFHLPQPDKLNLFSLGKKPPHKQDKSVASHEDEGAKQEIKGKKTAIEERLAQDKKSYSVSYLADNLLSRLMWWISASALSVLLIAVFLLSIYVFRCSLGDVKSSRRINVFRVAIAGCIVILTTFLFSSKFFGPHLFRELFEMLTDAQFEKGHHEHSNDHRKLNAVGLKERLAELTYRDKSKRKEARDKLKTTWTAIDRALRGEKANDTADTPKIRTLIERLKPDSNTDAREARKTLLEIRASLKPVVEVNLTMELWTSLAKAANLLVGLTLAVVIVATMAVCSILVHASNTPKAATVEGSSRNDKLYEVGRQLIQKKELLQLLLYGCAVLLIVGVFEIFALNRWPSIYYSSLDDQKAVEKIAAVLAGASGAFFSLLLVGIFAPALVILRLRSDKLLPADVKGKKERKQWLTNHGLEGLYSTSLQHLSRAAAVFGPMLVGFLGKVINLV